MADLLPPPSTGVPAVEDHSSPRNTMDFTPIWRQWFIDLVQIINKSGGTQGSVPASRTISTTLPLQGGGDLTADRTITIQLFSGARSGTVPASGGGTDKYLRADGTWFQPPSGVAGISATIPLAKLNPAGVNGSLTFVNGLLTSYTAPT